MAQTSGASIGIIADTHGLLRTGAIELLRSSDVILHAGDVGDPAVLQELGKVAPVVAIRGNVDHGDWAANLPATTVAETEFGLIYLLHDANELDLDPAAAGFAMVVSGHSHQPGYRERRGVKYLNPGSAGPRRFRLPVSLARIRRHGEVWSLEFLDILTGERLAIGADADPI